MPFLPPQGPDRRRAVAAIVWMVVTFAYLGISAGTYTGLYRLVAEFQLRHFGSYRETGSFIVPLFILWLPVRWIAPKFWRRPVADRSPVVSNKPTIPPAQSGTSRQSASSVQIVPRRWGPWKITLIALVASVVGVGSWVGITLALSWKELDAPYHADVTTIDLAKNEPLRPDAYLVVVVGEAQPAYMVAITKTFRGSETRKAYIPLTAPGWTRQQPIRVIRRERLNDNEPLPFGPDIDRRVRTDTLRIDQDGVPGIVRAELEEKGVMLAPDAIVIYDRFD